MVAWSHVLKSANIRYIQVGCITSDIILFHDTAPLFGKRKHKHVYLKEQGTKAMFAPLSKGRVLNLPVDVMLELFDKTVLPIMFYGCEIWGFGNNMLETVFLKFCKYLLGLKSSTPNCMVYGETGCYPVSLTTQIRIISYWLS